MSTGFVATKKNLQLFLNCKFFIDSSAFYERERVFTQHASTIRCKPYVRSTYTCKRHTPPNNKRNPQLACIYEQVQVITLHAACSNNQMQAIARTSNAPTNRNYNSLIASYTVDATTFSPPKMYAFVMSDL